MGAIRATTDGPLAVGCLTFRTAASVFQTLSRGAATGPFHGHVATVVAKLWLRIGGGKLTIMAPERPLDDADLPYPDGQSRGCYAASDLVPLKLRPEVTLVGNVEVSGAPRHSVDVRLALGAMEKRVTVHADRWLDAHGRLVTGAAFNAMPLVYERTAAGQWNPLGVRPAAAPAFVPNLTAPGEPPSAIADLAAMQPACFAPIPWAWPVRQGAHPLASNVGEIVRNAPVYLAATSQLSAFNTATPDQQLPRIRGGEELVIENVFADDPKFRAKLPALTLTGSAAGYGPITFAIDTVHIDALKRLCAVTYRAYLPLVDVHQDVAIAVATRASEPKPRSSRTGAKRQSPATMAIDPSQLVDTTLPFGNAELQAAISRVRDPQGGLPFRQPDAAKPVAESGVFAAVVEPPAAVRSLEPRVVEPPAVRLPEPRAVEPPAPAPVGVVLGMVPMTQAAGGASLGQAPPARAYEAYTPVAVGDGRVEASALKSPLRAPVAELFTLLGFVPLSLPFLRIEPSFRFLLDELQDEELDSDIDDPSLAESPAAFEDRRDVECLLTRSAPATEAELKGLHRVACEPSANLAAQGIASPAARYKRPLTVLDGMLELPFDEIDLLRATLGVATSHASVLPAVTEVMETARAFLASPGIPSAADVALALVQRIRATFDASGVAQAASFEDRTEPSLVDRRSRNFRIVCGGRFIRAKLALTSGGAFTAYLPESMNDVLPAARRVPVRAIARIHAALDELETQPITLEVLALASKARSG